MSRSTWRWQVVFILSLLTPLVAQTQDAVKRFETVAIHVIPPNAPPTIRGAAASSVFPGGRFTDPRIPLSVLIAFAYDVRQGAYVVGLPKWAENTSYSITAKAGEAFSASSPADNETQVRLMMRTMLSERFNLQLQPETKSEKGLKLEVGPTGLKLNEVPAPIPPEKEGYVFGVGDRNGGGRFVGSGTNMARLEQALTLCLGQPVVDATGFTGYFDIDLKWEGTGEEGAGGFGTPDFVAGALLALRDRLGLRLTRATVPVVYWRVTHVESPTEN